MGNQPGKSVDDICFEMKFQGKSLERLSKKAEKDEKKARKQCKDAITRGNKEAAEIYAQNAIRHRGESNNFLRMASKVDGVASKLKSVQLQKSVAQGLGQMSTEMGRALEQTDVMAIAQQMDGFERRLAELDTQGQLVEQATAQVTAQPTDQVDALIQEVAEQNALDLDALMPAAPDRQVAQQQQVAEPEPEVQVSEADEDRLMERLMEIG